MRSRQRFLQEICNKLDVYKSSNNFMHDDVPKLGEDNSETPTVNFGLPYALRWSRR